MLTFVILWLCAVLALILSTGGCLTGAFDPPLAGKVLMIFGWMTLIVFGFPFEEE